MRIIGGFASSLALTAPRSGTRPTSDRVREALFSALDARDLIRDAYVLDLYAGSGALGLEAISRGAASAILVERNAAAAGIARKNAQRVIDSSPGTPRVSVLTQSVQAYLRSPGVSIDLAFLDPPYDLPDDELVAVLEGLEERIATDGVVIVERSTRASAFSPPSWLESTQRRDYGDTAIHWLQPVSR